MHGFVSYRRFGKVRSLRSNRAVCVLGRYIATEPCACSVAKSLRRDRAVCVLSRYVATELGWSLRPSRVRPRSLRSDRAVCVLGRYVATELGLCVVRLPYLSLSLADLDTVRKLAGFLKTLEYWPRDKFWDLVSGCLILCLEMLETSVLGLGQDLGLITALGGAMATLTYVPRIVFNLIPSRFKVRDMFLAYVACMVGIENLFEDNF
ncbi:hypothetical protein F2Q68_00021223 [Brassica cretica]|uniref:Uncharacterized protein n=1 Tax=Brassica cretica TaxID=69181 RepID=A0A8S9FXF6_BRACR|nr:hypothetical protein F2Q68_00021223 [Brassica cretica]